MKKHLILLVLLLNLLPAIKICDMGLSTISAQGFASEGGSAYYCLDKDLGRYIIQPLPCDEEVCIQACQYEDCPYSGPCESMEFHIWVEHTDNDTPPSDDDDDNPNEPINGGGGYSGGNNNYHGSVPHSDKNKSDTKNKKAKNEIEEDCGAIPQSKEAKEQMKSILALFEKSSNFTYGNSEYNEFCSFDEYLNKISMTPSVEHGGSFECLKSEDTGHETDQYGLRFYEPGDTTSVHSQIYNSTIANLHSHTQTALSSPSAQDLLVFAEYGSDSNYVNYKGEIIVNCNESDTTLYFMMIKDRLKLKVLYDSIQNEVDSTHNFKDEGRCYKYLKQNKKIFKTLSVNDKLLMELILISKLFTDGGGMDIVKYQWDKTTERNKGQITAFGIKKEEIKKHSKVKTNLKPVKCP